MLCYFLFNMKLQVGKIEQGLGHALQRLLFLMLSMGWDKYINEHYSAVF